MSHGVWFEDYLLKTFLFLHKINLTGGYLTIHSIIPIKAGNACIKNIFFSTVNAPYIPAIDTQPKKKMLMLVFQTGSLIKKVHMRPAAKKPLYKPWLAANGLVDLNNSGGNFLNILGPLVVQANISNQRK